MEAIKQHFSKRILFLSFIFLLITGAWYILTMLSQSPYMYSEIAPKLVFASTQDVEVKTLYDADYYSANSGQSVFSDMSIKTSELEFAEITLGNNVVRMDQNTEIVLKENNYGNNEFRLTFELVNGSLWVNAFGGLEIETAQSTTKFSHSIAMITR